MIFSRSSELLANWNNSKEALQSLQFRKDKTKEILTKLNPTIFEKGIIQLWAMHYKNLGLIEVLKAKKYYNLIVEKKYNCPNKTQILFCMLNCEQCIKEGKWDLGRNKNGTT